MLLLKNFILGEANIDYSKVKNENCGVLREIPVATTELHIATENVEKVKNSSVPAIKVALGKVANITLALGII